MDFVHEEDVTRTQVGQDGSQITGALDGGTSRHLQVDAHLVGQDMRQRGFAQPRRAVEKDMVKRLPSLSSCFDQNRQVLFHLFLSDQVGQQLGTQCVVHAVIRLRVRVYEAVWAFGHGVDYT